MSEFVEDKPTQNLLSQTLIVQTLMTSGSCASEVDTLQSIVAQRMMLFRV
jgi:hypothetical protein